MTIQEQMLVLAQEAQQATRVMANLSATVKNDMLRRMAAALQQAAPALIKANDKDLEGARQKGLSAAMIDRLVLNDEGITAMADGLREVAELPDPVGEISNMRRRPNRSHAHPPGGDRHHL